MYFGSMRIVGVLVLSLALATYGQFVGRTTATSGVGSILAQNAANAPMDEFAFTDEEQGRFNWIVRATDLPWIGAFRFLPTPNAPTTILLSVSDTSGVALAQCTAPTAAVADEDEWTEFVWNLQPDSLHCNVSTSTTRFRFPLTVIPRKRYVVRVTAIEGPRCVAGLMVRNQKPTGCPPSFQRVVFVAQGFNCGCPRIKRTTDAAVAILDPQGGSALDRDREHHKLNGVPFPRFEPATSGLFNPTTPAPFVDDMTSPHWMPHFSTGGSFAEVSGAVTEVIAVEESSAEWTTPNPDINATAFPSFVWNNSSRAISPVNGPNPVRTAVDVAFASTSLLLPTTPAKTRTTTAIAITTATATTTVTATTASTTVTASRTASTSSPTTAARARGQSAASTTANVTASPGLTSSTVNPLEVASGAASTSGHTSTTQTTAPVGGGVASAPNITVTCTETSCQNNGTCVLVSDTDFECDCPVGFNGTLCESPPPCASDPCQNGGRCEEVEESFRCDCPPSTSGAYCEALLCENECHNGGECVVDESQFTKCNCSAGFLGYNCNMVDVCSGAVTPCDVFGSTATCQVVDEHASPFLVNATYQCLCPDGNNGQVECASLLSTTPLIANMPSVITTPAASLTSTTTSTSATSTTTSPPPPPTPTPTTTPSTTGLPSSTLTTELWSTTPTTTATAILAESSTAGSIRGAVEESTDGGGTGTVTIVLVVVGVAVLLLVLFFAALLSVRFVRRSRKLHGKYNPAKEESMVGAGLSLPMATINKEERLI